VYCATGNQPASGLANEAFLADRNHAPIGNGALLGDGMRLGISAHREKPRDNTFPAGGGFGIHSVVCAFLAQIARAIDSASSVSSISHAYLADS
jgi:hypothetical protein